MYGNINKKLCYILTNNLNKFRIIYIIKTLFPVSFLKHGVMSKSEMMC